LIKELNLGLIIWENSN